MSFGNKITDTAAAMRNATRNRVDAAEAAAVTPKAKPAAPKTSKLKTTMPIYKEPAQAKAARLAADEVRRAKEYQEAKAAQAARNAKMSLRTQ